MHNDQMFSVNAGLQDERKLKFVRKFMLLANTVANDNNACYSRKIGCIIADYDYRLVSMGYNGPPSDTPHTDTYDYLKNFFIPQLTEEELCFLDVNLVDHNFNLQDRKIDDWCQSKHNCKQCPRRFVNAGPGQRSTLCSCQHAERNAITNSNGSIQGCMIYCWCGVPCIDCAGAIINSGLSEVHCLIVDGPDYHPESRWLLKKGGVELFEYRPSYFLPSMTPGKAF